MGLHLDQGIGDVLPDTDPAGSGSTDLTGVASTTTYTITAEKEGYFKKSKTVWRSNDTKSSGSNSTSESLASTSINTGVSS